jgi:subtilisin family serine protease
MDDTGQQRVMIALSIPAAVEGDAIPTMAAQELAISGLELDPNYRVQLRRAGPDATAEAGAGTRTVVVRGTVTPEALEALRNNPAVQQISEDTVIAPFQTGTVMTPDLELTAMAGTSPCSPFDCDASGSAEGDLAAMAKALRADQVWAAGYQGDGIVIGICDTGVRQADIPALIDGWTPPGGSPVGDNSAHPHGTMCSTDALGACPNAKILDIGILKSIGGINGLLSDALAAYDWALTRFLADGTPQILSNSWGIFQENWSPDYACNSNHLFTQKVVEVIDAGMLVVYAAGNCGQVCPSSRCSNDTGPGRSIWGANGHPRVITVGAVNVKDEWVGYTSQGPSCMSERKPDICGISHFKGYTPLDNGTSAACPTIAGVLGLLKQAKPDLTQDEAQNALMSTARNVCAPGWDTNSGAGVVDAEAARQALAKTGAAAVPAD